MSLSLQELQTFFRNGFGLGSRSRLAATFMAAVSTDFVVFRPAKNRFQAGRRRMAYYLGRLRSCSGKPGPPGCSPGPRCPRPLPAQSAPRWWRNQPSCSMGLNDMLNRHMCRCRGQISCVLDGLTQAKKDRMRKEVSLENPRSGWWISVTSRMCKITKLDNEYFFVL